MSNLLNTSPEELKVNAMLHAIKTNSYWLEQVFPYELQIAQRDRNKTTIQYLENRRAGAIEVINRTKQELSNLRCKRLDKCIKV